MQKRLNSRDWILYSLIILLILLVLLVMYQVDRQWARLDQMQTALSEQAQDMRITRTKLDQMQVARLEQTKDIRAMRTELSTKTMVAPTALAMMPANTQVTQAAPAVATAAQQTPPPAADETDTKVAPAFQRAYAATQQDDYAQGDWSVNAFSGGLATITPLVSSDADASTVQSHVLESLLTRNPDTLEWDGLIAQSWTVSDDGLVIQFKLREDVTFSDGKPLTAQDVVFSFNFAMTEAIQAPGERSLYERIESVKADNPYTVTFTYKDPYFEALGLAGSIAILPKHFYEPYLETPQEFNESKGLLLGSGPYRLSDPKGWTPDIGNVELIRNDRYWGDVQPSYNRILWKIIQNDSARLTTYRNGEIDAYGARPVEYAKLKADEQIMGKSQNFEYMSPVASYAWIGWSQGSDEKPSRFADKRVRQAMTYMTDVGRVIEDVYLNYGEAAVGPFSNTSKQHDPNLKPYAFDLDKASALLKEAGYEDRDGNGVIENAEGEPFEFKLTYFQGNEDTNRMVLLLKDIYAQAGVKLVPFPQEWPVMVEALNKKDFEAITLAWTSGVETDINQMFHSSQTITNGNNFINYKNPELDKLIDEARATVDEEKRMKIWGKAEKILYEDQPYTFLFRRQTLAFIDQRIKNLGLTKLGLNRTFLPTEVYVPADKQVYTQ